ncbi:hypothetical protein [Dickeya lacustris]|uniref:Uncharacterized protein n=1 Tax=Dickeya lacustris TaxID=2259638 RepID=A0ABY8GBM1_9GAMM|nr:hypothetical protein [Dickeya lacustris]WFN57315.1 hypothetical protein O1Q98_09050 [Dickeya lacustris]
MTDAWLGFFPVWVIVAVAVFSFFLVFYIVFILLVSGKFSGVTVVPE